MAQETFCIVAVDPLPPKLQDLFRQQLPAGGFRFVCPEGPRTDELLGLARQAHFLVTRHRIITKEIMSAAGTRLRLIQVMGRLPDRVDLESAKSAGVPVATMPHGGAIAVAEHTMTLMLAVARKLPAGHQGVVGGKYRESGLEPARTSEWSFSFNWLGFPDVVELRGRTLGLIGLGEIGREVACRARAFDMKILYCQRRRLSACYEKLLGVRMAGLEELLRESDIVSLHVPHTDETERMLGATRLALMKPSSFLVNTARGGLVDEAALIDCLRARRIAGAGLDVFVQEPLPAGHPLLGLDNVVLTPHIGGGSGGGQKLHFRQVIENLLAAAGGGTPHNLVE
ncbi:MAG: NAD(P)-dependent oxidoreductase [Acidobacteriota bacterium]